VFEIYQTELAFYQVTVVFALLETKASSWHKKRSETFTSYIASQCEIQIPTGEEHPFEILVLGTSDSDQELVHV
jgi:hypothetical protein